ncbi:MAG: calcium-binding protein, partial [Allosphingosinicella sp.]
NAGGGNFARAANTLDGGGGNDTLVAHLGVSSPVVDSASNNLKGGAGNDSLTAWVTASSNAVNSLDGGDGDDILLAGLTPGSVGHSELFGGAGDDLLTVIGGDDNRFADGFGRDWMIGGDGKDNFVLTVNDTALDIIAGFSGVTGEQDKIDLTAFAAGATNSFSAGILTVNGEQVAEVFGSFDPATDLILA